ncbi:MAG TPA: glycosyltransferase family 2 protein [Thermoanaerobacter sp.]|nr:glycosyltransferase family 2 protein [Thermoanaerobacter sp.]
MLLSKFVLLAAILFWILILYYFVLTIFGLLYKTKNKKERDKLNTYPSVDILIPAHNEEKVLFETLDAVTSLYYPGELNIYLLNDNSTDKTGEIADYFATLFKNVHHIKVPPGSPKGKARVLNYGMLISKGELIVVYDADNQPDKYALIRLVNKTLENKRYAGAVGYVKTINMYKNSLTRMIGLEFMVFQLIMQAGRWNLFKVGMLTGTNMLVRRDVLNEINGWDPYALAEDAELSMRIYAKGYLLPIVTDSITWEQEPENLRVWIRQKTRWMQGNLYLISKVIKDKNIRKEGKNKFNIFQMISIYYIFVSLVIASDVWFVLGLLNKLTINYKVPLVVLWFETLWIYTVQISASAVAEKEISLTNVLFAVLMYFTYAQFWIYLVVKGYILQIRNSFKKIEPIWDKTIRF